MSYSINEHSHRFSAWAASRAASASPLCRFEVSLGVKALEECGFDQRFTIDDLPAPEQIDLAHLEWRNRIIKSKHLGVKHPSHGVAAKLINIYLKGRFVCGGFHNDDRVKALHPPIDSILLKELQDKNVGGYKNEWKKYREKRWSNFSSEDYEKVIQLIDQVSDGEPLWMIEKYWNGFR
jgi:hypothetical protein